MTVQKLTSAQAEVTAEEFWNANVRRAIEIFDANPWLATARKPDEVSDAREEYFIHHAIALRSDDLIERGLDHGVYLEHRNRADQTVLGALLNRLEFDGLNPIRWAAQVNRVLMAGARCDALDDRSRPLWLMNRGEIPPGIVKKLIAGGAALDGVTLGGAVWLSELLRTMRDYEDAPYVRENVRLIVEAGANVNLAPPHDLQGSPLGVLSGETDTQLHDLLLAHGANVRIKGQRGDELLHHPASPQVIRWLLDHGADLEAKNLKGQTPLMATLLGSTGDKKQELVALLAAGASVDVEFEPGFTARDVLNKLSHIHPKAIAALAAREARSTVMDVLEEIEADQKPKQVVR